MPIESYGRDMQLTRRETAIARGFANGIERLVHEQRFVTGNQVTGGKRFQEMR